MIIVLIIISLIPVYLKLVLSSLLIPYLLLVKILEAMPLPKKNKKETKNEFISRCMNSQIMEKEFPEKEQRIAVCDNLSKENETK